MIETKKSPARTGHISNNSHSNHNTLELILSRVSRVRQTGPDRWMFSCPGPLHKNGDRNTSASARECADGTILLHCFAGCEISDMTAPIGIELRDLFPPKPYKYTPRKDGITAAKRREYKALLKQESYLVKFAQGVMLSGGEITADDAERVLLADQRVRKLRGLLHV